MTGVPKINAIMKQNASARPLRMAPLVVLICGVLGLGLQISRSPLGIFVIEMALLASCFVLGIGPFRRFRTKPRDEREVELVRKGHLAGLIVAMTFTVIGCLYCAANAALSALTAQKLWSPSNPIDWIALAEFVIVLEFNVATMAASLNWPRGPIDDEG
jgi:hypothetical protein